jgi:hypothetical protein
VRARSNDGGYRFAMPTSQDRQRGGVTHLPVVAASGLVVSRCRSVRTARSNGASLDQPVSPFAGAGSRLWVCG